MVGSKRVRGVAAVAVGVVIALAASLVATTPVTAVPAASSAQAATPPAPPAAATIQTRLAATSPAAPGGLSTLSMSLGNLGGAVAQAPVTATVSGLPSGVSVLGLAPTDARFSWSCSPVSGGGVCTLVTAKTTDAVPLAGSSSLESELTLGLGAGASVGKGISVKVAVGVGPTTNPTPDLKGATAVATVLPLGSASAGALAVTSDIPSSAEQGAPVAGTVRIRNLGPALVGGPSAKVSVSGVIPAGATAASASGTGWACAGVPLACTWTGAAVAKGAGLAPLAVRFKAPATPTAKGKAITTTITATATRSGSKPSVGTSHANFLVAARPTPAIALTAAPSGSNGTEVPGFLRSALKVTGTDLVSGQTVTIAAKPPTGFNYLSMSSDDPWTCAASKTGDRALRCSRPGDLADGVPSALTITWAVGNGTPPGGATVVFQASVPGEAAGATGDNSAAVPYLINRSPAAGLHLRSWTYKDSVATLATDGAAKVITAGRTGTLGIDATNSGGSPIPAGTEVHVSVNLPKGSTASTTTDSGAPAWKCPAPSVAKAGALLRCTLVLGAPVAVNAAIPRLRALVRVPSSTPVGVSNWSLRASASVAGKAVPTLSAKGRATVSVVKAPVLAAAPNLTVAIVKAPRAGGRAGLVRITYANGGSAPAAAANTLVFLPTGIASVAPLPSGCTPAPFAYRPAQLVCSTPAGLAPGATSVKVVSVRASASAPSKGEIRLQSITGSARVSAHVSIEPLPKLVARATASPSLVTDLAIELPATPVLLDSATSSAVDATASWSQVPTPGEPAVAFEGAPAGATTFVGVTASFPAPRVETVTDLHLRLTVTDGTTTSVDDTTVTVKPEAVTTMSAAVAGGSRSMSGNTDDVAAQLHDQRESGPSGFGHRAAFRPSLAGSTAPTSATEDVVGSWTSTSAPDVSRNDIGADTPVLGSRVRVLQNGSYFWPLDAGPEPTDVSLTREWQSCALDTNVDPPTVGACSPFTDDPTGWVAIVTAADSMIRLRETVQGLDAGGQTVRLDFDYDIGAVAFDDSTPSAMVAPTISGTVEPGHTLTATPGQWTIENGISFHWSTCTAVGDCELFGGTDGPTYDVTNNDRGTILRLTVTATGYGPNYGDYYVYTSTVPGSPVCGTSDCWQIVGDPVVDANPLHTAEPIAGYPATLTSPGVWNWLDPDRPPTDVHWTVQWAECDKDGCYDAGTGMTGVPQRVGTQLFAWITYAGTQPNGAGVASALYYHLVGTVQAPAAPPVNTGPPEIIGAPVAGTTLAANPGVWDYAIHGAGAPGSEFSYRWFRCEVANPTACQDTFVSTPTYEVTAADQLETSYALQVRVTAKGVTPDIKTTASSALSAPISGPTRRNITPPTLKATPPVLTVGMTLEYVPGTWSALPTSTPSVRWQRCNISHPPAPPANPCSNIGGATGTTYKLAAADKDFRIRVVETQTSTDGASSAMSSTAAMPDVVGTAGDLTVSVDVGTQTYVASSTEVTLVGSSAGGVAPRTGAWTQISGETVSLDVNGEAVTLTTPAGAGDLVLEYEVTDGNGTKASVQVTVTYGSTLSSVFCDVFAAAASATADHKTVALGDDLELGFTNATVSAGPGCSAEGVATITNATVMVFGWLRVNASTVTVTSTGVTFDGVTLDALDDASLGGVQFRGGANLSIPFTSDEEFIDLKGSVLADGIPFVTLPSAWQAQEELVFGSTGGVQTLTLHGVAYQGKPEALSGTLPKPPAGVPSVEILGSVASDHTGSLEVTANNVVSFGDGSLDLTGSVTRDEEGEVTFTASGDLVGTATLSDGVTLTSAHLGWDGDAFDGAGSLTISVGGSDLTVDVAFSFSDPTAWKASVKAGLDASWEPSSGFVVTNPTISGSVERDGDTTTASIEIGATSLDLGSDAHIDDPTFTVGVECAEGDECETTVGLAGTVVAKLPGQGAELTVAVSGELDVTSGSFKLEASVAGFDVAPGLTVSSAALKVESGDEEPSLSFSATATVFDAEAAVTITFDDEGAYVEVRVAWDPEGLPDLDDVELVYSSTARTLDLDSGSFDVPANSFFATASTHAPAWLTSLLGTPVDAASLTGSVNLDSGEFNVRASVSLGTPATLFDLNAVAISARSIALHLTYEDGVLKAGIEGDTHLSMVVPGLSPIERDLRLAGSYDSAGNVSGSLTMPGLWENAFGIPGLSISDLTVGVSFGPDTSPGVGFSGGVSLPSAWSSAIGLTAGTTINLAATVSESPCVKFELVRPVGAPAGQNVLDLAKAHVLTAKVASFYVAPTTCTIGDLTIPQGFSLDFDGELLGVPVKVEAGMSAEGMHAHIAVGSFSFGGLGVTSPYLDIDISEASAKIAFGGSVGFYGASATVTGAFSATPTGGVSSDFTGVFAGPSVGGFPVASLTTTFHFKSEIVKGEPRVTLRADGSAHMELMGQSVDASMDFTFQNGTPTKVHAAFAVKISVSKIAIDGTGTFDHQTPATFPTIVVKGTLKAFDRTLTEGTLTVGNGSAQITASLGLDLGFGTPQLRGAVVWAKGPYAVLVSGSDGRQVPAQPGDFSLWAEMSPHLAGFDASAGVSFGYIGGTFFAKVHAFFTIGIDAVNATVNLNGSFDTSGSVSVTGSASLSVGGFTLFQPEFSLRKFANSSDVQLHVKARLAVPYVSTVQFEGYFIRYSTGTRYYLSGLADVSVAGYHLGSASLRLWRWSPSDMGLAGSVRLDLPGLAVAQVNLTFGPQNVSFDASLSLTGKLGALLGNTKADVSFRAGQFPNASGSGTSYQASLKFSATIHDLLGLPTGDLMVAGSWSTTGAYSFSMSSHVRWGNHWNAGFCTVYGYITFDTGFTVTGTFSSISVLAHTDFSMEAGCGRAGASIGGGAYLSVDSTPSLHGRVYISINYGFDTYRHTFLSF